jgi:hypothetical protein
MQPPDHDPLFEFIYTAEFLDSVEGMLTDEDFHDLELQLLAMPERGKVIPGTGGVRKLRIALPGRGKSGGARILYVFAAGDEQLFLLLAYAKSVRETLTAREKQGLKEWVRTL